MNEGKAMNICCLLVVDDDAADASVIQRTLALSQLKIGTILTATSLAEATLVITQKPVDVILLDLDLGDSRSLDTLRAVRALSDAVIIVLNAAEDELLGIEALKCGADDFLVKSQMTEKCLRASIVQSMTRHSLRVTAKRINSKLEMLSKMAGVA